MSDAVLGILWLLVFFMPAVCLLAAFVVAAIYIAHTFTYWWVDGSTQGKEPDVIRDNDSLNSTMLNEFFSAGWLLSLHPLGLLEPGTSPLMHTGRNPILLVHGYMLTRSSLWVLRRRLESMGFGPFYTVNLCSRDGIEAQADALSKRISEVICCSGANQIDIVAHSSGGLVARVAALRWPLRIRRLVCLGTPFHGTKMAYLGHGQMARDMEPGSRILEMLPDPPVHLIVSIFSLHDNVVIPSDSACISPLGRDVEVEHIGHFGLLTDPEVAKEVAKALGQDARFFGSRDLFDRIVLPSSELPAHRGIGRRSIR